jgi:hypothetical protein
VLQYSLEKMCEIDIRMTSFQLYYIFAQFYCQKVIIFSHLSRRRHAIHWSLINFLPHTKDVTYFLFHFIHQKSEQYSRTLIFRSQMCARNSTLTIRVCTRWQFFHIKLFSRHFLYKRSHFKIWLTISLPFCFIFEKGEIGKFGG